MPRTSLVIRFLSGFTHFFALILWLAAALAFLADAQDPSAGLAPLGWAILGVIVLNGVFSFWQEFRAEKALVALLRLLPHEVKVVRTGNVSAESVDQLVPGDVVLLDAGDDVPADCLLLEAFGVRVNNATVTGESIPQTRRAGPCSEEDLLHAKNVLLAGTSIVSGECRALVFATGMRTEFGKIAHLTQDSRAPLSPLQKEIVRISHLIAGIALGLGVVFFLLGRSLGLGLLPSLLFGIGILVANVPEGLLPTVTLALAMASQRMARRQALIRHLPSVEALGCANVICTDKTGTLTLNRMSVAQLYLDGQVITPADLARPTPGHRDLLLVMRLCHTLRQTARNGHEEMLGDPMEIALVKLAEEVLSASGNWQPSEYRLIDEIPFDSERKRLSLLYASPQGLMVCTKGAPETVLPLCATVRQGQESLPLSEESRAHFLTVQQQLADQGLRVLAIACRHLEQRGEGPYEKDMVLLGLVGLEDPPRPEVPEAVRLCKQAGIKVIMITGDHPHTARAIARQIGLVESDTPVILTGEQIRRLSATQLQLALGAPEILCARVSADQKLRIVQALEAKKLIVAVTGDGVNDAPALRQADIGIAMGRSGTDVAREAADMVLLDDNFASIVAAVRKAGPCTPTSASS